MPAIVVFSMSRERRVLHVETTNARTRRRDPPVS
jgi:hypothetical protein